MNTQSHILSSFNESLSTINSHLHKMVELVESSLQRTKTGFAEADPGLCSEVVADDDIINGEERVIDNLAMDVLLRYNPMASDLRFVVSSISIAKNLERIGDHASRVAKQTRKIYKKNVLPDDIFYIDELYLLIEKQFSYAKKAILNADLEAAQICFDCEEVMTAKSKELRKLYLNMMADDSEKVSAYMNLIMIARSMQRISKICCNIAEDIIYIETAESSVKGNRA